MRNDRGPVYPCRSYHPPEKQGEIRQECAWLLGYYLEKAKCKRLREERTRLWKVVSDG